MRKAIGVFDSGVGGLTVAKEIIKCLPQEDIVYFGDTARVPYGIKSKETVRRFSLESAFFLLKNNVKLIVIACNTSSSIALPSLRKSFKIPVIGVISPGAREAVRSSRNNRIGIIGTKATIRSRAYQRQIKRLNPKVKVYSYVCPLFVPLAEEGWLNGSITLDIARKYLSSLKKDKVDTLILGCTHYPLLKPVIARVMGRPVKLVDSARQVALEVKEILGKAGLLYRNKTGGVRRMFYVSDELEEFSLIAKRFLGRKITNLKRVRV